MQGISDDASGGLEGTLEVASAIGVHVAGVRQRHSSGEMRLVEIYLSPLESGAESMVHLTVHDITERARAEERARVLLAEQVAQQISARAAQEWQGTFDAIEQPLIVVDASGNVTRANQATTILTTASAADMVGRSLTSLGDDALWSAAASHAAVAERYGSVGIARVRDATGRTWEIDATRFVPEGDVAPRIIVALREITQLIALQTEIQRQETLSRMGELVGGVAHEVRNPLFALSSALDAMRHRMGDHPDFARYAPHIESQITRLSALVRDLLDYGRPSALSLRDAPVADLLRGTVELTAGMAESASVRLDISATCAAGAAVRVDRARILVVLQNLVTNAIQHSPKGSLVELTANADARDGTIEFRVTDEGPGFSSDTLDRVFEPFFTKRPGGTGLGLALAYRTVHDHGGTITAENRFGKQGQIRGAELQVRLPEASAPTPHHRASE